MADLQGALEGHRAAEAELEAARGELLSLHVAAVEGMRDAARHVDAAQVFEQTVGRATHMQHHRQAVRAGQLQLRNIEALLALAVRTRHEMVEPDFTDGHQARVVLAGLQCSRPRRRKLINFNVLVF